MASRFSSSDDLANSLTEMFPTLRNMHPDTIPASRAEGQKQGVRIDEGAEIPDIPLRRSSKTPGPSFGYFIGSKTYKSRKKTGSGTIPKISSKFKELTSSRNGSVNHGPMNPTIPAQRVERVLEASQARLTSDYNATSPSKNRVRRPSPPPQAGVAESNHGVAGVIPNPPAPMATTISFAPPVRARSPPLPPLPPPSPPANLPPLQMRSVNDTAPLEPAADEENASECFDLVVPPSQGANGMFALERRSEQLFSREHFQIILDDPVFFHRFAQFLSTHRPESYPLLLYYLDALKALRAINYSNAIISSLRPLRSLLFTQGEDAPLVHETLQAKVDEAFERLANDDLAAFITYTWIHIVNASIKRRITGSMAPELRDLSDGLAEVFCLTDPSRPNNPIVFASEEFHRTTQYGVNYAIGRNCRFLQGPKTNPFSIRRIRDKLTAGQQHHETFLNYRRDGSPFMNLLMCAPLIDNKGTIRYFIGAQVDVSGLVQSGTGLESFRRLVLTDDESNNPDDMAIDGNENSDENNTSTVAKMKARPKAPVASKKGKKGEFRELCELFDHMELETARQYGGAMQNSHQQPGGVASITACAPQSVAVANLLDHGGGGNYPNSFGFHDQINNGMNQQQQQHKQRVLIQDDGLSGTGSCSEGGSSPSSPEFRESSQPNATTSTNNNTISDGNDSKSANNRRAEPPSSPKTRARNLVSSTSAGAPPTTPAPTTPLHSQYSIFDNYLLVRPYPSLRIVFASPWLRLPGILQSPFMSKIAGSPRIQAELTQAFAEGHGVTAKVKWRAGTSTGSKSTSREASSRARWIHCTPLLGSTGAIGVWMVVVVDADDARPPPPPTTTILPPKPRSYHPQSQSHHQQPQPSHPQRQGSHHAEQRPHRSSRSLTHHQTRSLPLSRRAADPYHATPPHSQYHTPQAQSPQLHHAVPRPASPTYHIPDFDRSHVHLHSPSHPRSPPPPPPPAQHQHQHQISQTPQLPPLSTQTSTQPPAQIHAQTGGPALDARTRSCTAATASTTGPAMTSESGRDSANIFDF